MTLSDKRIQRLLDRDFVTTWSNTADDAAAGSSFAHPPGDPPPQCLRGNGEHNLQILVLTADLELLDAIAGFIEPDALLAELEFALRLAKDVAQAPQQRRADVVTTAHERFAEAIDPAQFTGLFGTFERSRVEQDHRFTASHPLLPATSFRIEDLVGSATTFFGSSSGTAPGGTLGNPGAIPGFDVNLPGGLRPPTSSPGATGGKGSGRHRQGVP